MAKTIKVGMTVKVSKKEAYVGGLVGKVFKDELSGKEFAAVEFDTKDARSFMWGPKENCWYVDIKHLTEVKPDTLTLGTPSLADDLRLGLQCRKILAHLERFGEVTNNAAFITYHVSRLSDVIMKLRRAGYDIVTEMKKDGVGGQYAKYLYAR